MDNIKVSEEEFKAFKEVQEDTTTNMNDIEEVSKLSGLSERKIKAIIYDYDSLLKEYNRRKRLDEKITTDNILERS